MSHFIICIIYRYKHNFPGKLLIECLSIVQQDTSDNLPHYYSSADQFLDTTDYSIELPLYSVPIRATLANNDYEAIPKLDNFKQPHPTNKVQYNYLLPTSNIGIGDMQRSILPLHQTIAKDEPIYKDPGHIKEEIYKWFKQRNICELDKNRVR